MTTFHPSGAGGGPVAGWEGLADPAARQDRHRTSPLPSALMGPASQAFLIWVTTMRTDWVQVLGEV